MPNDNLDTDKSVPGNVVHLIWLSWSPRDENRLATYGETLRRYIEKQSKEKDPYAVSEWNWRGPVQPNLMVRTKEWKYFIPNSADSKVMNVLYDLKSDPHEMNNLLGKNPDKEKHRKQAEYMKGLLLEWLKKSNSPHLAEVKQRDAVK